MTNCWDKTFTQKLTSLGISWEHARQVVGLVAEERMGADREGYTRGFNDGAQVEQERQAKKMIRDKRSLYSVLFHAHGGPMYPNIDPWKSVAEAAVADGLINDGKLTAAGLVKLNELNDAIDSEREFDGSDYFCEW